LRYFIELSYHGLNYHGWQVQPDVVTVQERLTEALSVILRKKIDITGAGRTDAGVHATQLFAHFDSAVKFDVVKIQQKVNAFLPEDIVVASIFLVNNDVHARFDAISRSYEYRIWLGRNPFLLETTWQIHQQKLAINKMNEAAEILLNYTNFKCFSKSKTDVRTYNCKITEAKWILEENRLTFYITADRFLRNMVRAIVGTLIEVGLGKKTKEDFIAVIESEDRSKAGVSVPAKGLFLTKIIYNEDLKKRG